MDYQTFKTNLLAKFVFDDDDFAFQGKGDKTYLGFVDSGGTKYELSKFCEIPRYRHALCGDGDHGRKLQRDHRDPRAREIPSIQQMPFYDNRIAKSLHELFDGIRDLTKDEFWDD